MDNSWHGKITEFFPDGKIKFKGSMENGKYHGKGWLFKQEGDVVTLDKVGTWKEGEFVKS